MHLYHLPAQGSVNEPSGISPAFPAGVRGFSWGGAYDEESNMYVVRTEEPVEGLEEFEFTPDNADHVTVDFSGLIAPRPLVDESSLPPQVADEQVIRPEDVQPVADMLPDEPGVTVDETGAVADRAEPSEVLPASMLDDAAAHGELQ